MISAKSLGKTRSAKALHFTREKGTIEAAEAVCAWLEENQSLPDLEPWTGELVLEVEMYLLDISVDTDGALMEMPDAHADVDMTPIDDRKIGDPNPPEIKEKINQDLLKQVMEMGFSEVRAEKAGRFARKKKARHTHRPWFFFWYWGLQLHD
ncbi:unnamed protein product [Durusdinium trenchii]|uniref:UBA domain-containing protein n=1 Tax=Durusdinium trenchii TaxID=1381693 RepID=A0ABP0LE54_9DINO